MYTKYSLTFCIILICLSKILAENVNIINPVRYPYGGPFVGIFLAIAIPLELPNYNVFVSYNFEANYNLPQNETDYSWPPDVTRNFPFDRKFAYTAIENKMKKTIDLSATSSKKLDAIN